MESLGDLRRDFDKENLKKLENKLKKPKFIQKAPDNIVEQFRNQLTAIKSSIEKFEEIMNTIK